MAPAPISAVSGLMKYSWIHSLKFFQQLLESLPKGQNKS